MVADREVQRTILELAASAARAFRVVILTGPRQAGKTTLMRQLCGALGGDAVDLDNEALRAAALSDPSGVVLTDAPFLFVDEVQRGGDALVRAVKQRVDDPADTTRFVLAGSTDFLSVPTLAESLAGRAALLEVWPFSQGEIVGRVESFVDRVFGEPEALRGRSYEPVPRADYLGRVCAGGYPEALRLAGRMRSIWFRSYVQTVTQRDVVEIARIRRAAELPTLLRFLAAKTGQELVKADLARQTGLERNTLASYLPLLSTVFLVRELPAWSRNPLGKVTRHPKIHLLDTGLAAHLTGVDPSGLARPVAPMRGQLVETFVHNEIAKQRTWSTIEVDLFHWRDREGAEVDLILETPDGRVVAVESKAALDVRGEDFSSLNRLASRLGDQFVHGVVVHLGPRAVRFGPKLTALPLSALWEG